MTLQHFNSSVWILAIVLSIAMFWVKKQSIRSWLYVVMGFFGCVSLALQIIWLHETVNVFICGGYIVMNTYFWIRTREMMERKNALKEKGDV